MRKGGLCKRKCDQLDGKKESLKGLTNAPVFNNISCRISSPSAQFITFRKRFIKATLASPEMLSTCSQVPSEWRLIGIVDQSKLLGKRRGFAVRLGGLDGVKKARKADGSGRRPFPMPLDDRWS